MSKVLTGVLRKAIRGEKVKEISAKAKLRMAVINAIDDATFKDIPLNEAYEIVSKAFNEVWIGKAPKVN